jgi:hypothetical protein
MNPKLQVKLKPQNFPPKPINFPSSSKRKFPTNCFPTQLFKKISLKKTQEIEMLFYYPKETEN